MKSTSDVPAVSFEIVLCGERHPHDDDFDHAYTSVEFTERAEAIRVFDAPDPLLALARIVWPDGDAERARWLSYYRDTCFLWLLGPSVEDERVRTLRAPRPRTIDRMWQSEQAMQAGMDFGCYGYNEAMGYA